MPRTTYQTRPEILEAFVGDYAALADVGDQRVVRTGKHVTHLLENGPAGIHDPELKTFGIPKEIYAEYREGFADHVQARLANPEDVHTMAMVGKMVRNYELYFKDIIDAKITPSGFDNGRRSNAHRLCMDGKYYVVRKPYWNEDRDTPVGEIHKHAVAATLVADIPHMEHVEAISYKDTVTISPYIRGVSLRDMASAEELRAIQSEQVLELYMAAKLAESRGVRFDGAPSNLRYHPEDGFTFIDLDTDTLRGQTVELAFYSIVEYLRQYGVPERDAIGYLVGLKNIAETIVACMKEIDIPDATIQPHLEQISRICHGIQLRSGDE